jgi:hypothetical protein
MKFDQASECACHNLIWLTLFDLTLVADFPLTKPSTDDKIPPSERSTSPMLMAALISRLTELVPGKYTTPDDVWDLLIPDESISPRQIIPANSCWLRYVYHRLTGIFYTSTGGIHFDH